MYLLSTVPRKKTRLGRVTSTAVRVSCTRDFTEYVELGEVTKTGVALPWYLPTYLPKIQYYGSLLMEHLLQVNRHSLRGGMSG
jgi:hypothetical protein